MSVVATLMDKARARRGIPTDMALGERLGRSRQVVSQWRSGDKYPDEDVIVQLAELAGDDPAQWLIAIKAVRTEGPAGKVWTALAKRLGAATVVMLCAIGFSVPVAGNAYAARVSGPNEPLSASSECLLCQGDWGWWAQLAKWWLAWKLRGSRSTTWSAMACNAA